MREKQALEREVERLKRERPDEAAKVDREAEKYPPPLDRESGSSGMEQETQTGYPPGQRLWCANLTRPDRGRWWPLRHAFDSLLLPAQASHQKCSRGAQEAPRSRASGVPAAAGASPPFTITLDHFSHQVLLCPAHLGPDTRRRLHRPMSSPSSGHPSTQ